MSDQGFYVAIETETDFSQDESLMYSEDNDRLILAVTYDLNTKHRVWFENDLENLINFLLSFKKIIGNKTDCFLNVIEHCYPNQYKETKLKLVDLTLLFTSKIRPHDFGDMVFETIGRNYYYHRPQGENQVDLLLAGCKQKSASIYYFYHHLITNKEVFYNYNGQKVRTILDLNEKKNNYNFESIIEEITQKMVLKPTIQENIFSDHIFKSRLKNRFQKDLDNLYVDLKYLREFVHDNKKKVMLLNSLNKDHLSPSFLAKYSSFFNRLFATHFPFTHEHLQRFKDIIMWGSNSYSALEPTDSGDHFEDSPPGLSFNDSILWDQNIIRIVILSF